MGKVRLLPISPVLVLPSPSPSMRNGLEAYKKETGTGMNYQSIGSSGDRQIRAKTVAFGATDAPVSGADLE